MSLSKKSVALLLAFCMLFTAFAGCHRNVDPDPTSGPEGPTGPKRPADPGVIAPLSMESELPENGIVWDMENIPDNLNTEIWATPVWADSADYVERNVEFLGVDGKGYGGSRALALRQNGNYLWCDVYSLGMKRDETAVLNWRGGAMLWVWYDSSEIPGNMLLELEVNGAHLATGTPYYVLEEGQTVAKKGGKTPEAWDGAGYGRIPLSGDSRGWVGVPLSAFEIGLGKINFFNFHLSYSGTQPVGSCLYLDNFCVTLPGVGPMGAELLDVSAQLATSDKPAWDMENLPDDLLAAGWAVMDGEGWDNFVPGNLKLLGAAGKGVNGSRALQIRQIGSYNGADVFSLGITNDKTAFSDWTGGRYLWFWVDTTGIRNDLRLDLFVDGQKPPIGTPYYGIDSGLKIQQAGTLTKAWDGAAYGRMTVGAGYRGWVGLPLSAYGTVEDILNITLHLAYDGSFENAGRSVYFDEFWVLQEGEIPKDATGASIAVLRGGGASAMGLGATANLPYEVWSMNNLPSNPVSSEWAYPEYRDNKDFIPNNVTYFRADGKGWQGSAALGIRQNGSYSWADIYNLDLTRDGSAVRNWSNGKMLWFYADASEHNCEVRLDLAFDGVKPKVGGNCYLIPDGESAATTKVMKAAWDGADYGRVVLSTGFKGWVGIPLDQFTTRLNGGNSMQIHVAYSGDEIKGKSTYLDALWVTADMTAPNGVAVKTVSDKDVKAVSGKAAWDMENLPNNLITSGWAACDFSGEKDYRADNVQYLGASGKGRNQSRALQIKFNGSYSWTDQFTVMMKSDPDAATDWSGGKMLWIWVNGAELMASVELELWLGENKVDASAGWYEIKDGKAVKGGELIKAWDGKGRLPVQAGYQGFLGIPLSGYGSVSVVRNLTVHIAGSGVAAGRSLYLDELWITGLNQIPANAEDGRIVEEEINGDLELPLVAWDMEALPDDPMASGVVSPKYPDNDQYIKNNVTVTGAAGKGYQGSRAMAFRYQGNYSWADIFELELSKDEKAVTDWAGAKMLWLWVDASAFGVAITVEPQIDGRGLKSGMPVYTVTGSSAKPVSETFLSWDGATNARFRIPSGFTGWIGLPFEAFARTPATAKVMEIHCGFDGSNGYQGKTLYLDQLMLTDDVTGPEGSAIQNGATDPTSVNRAVWTMENLPENLSSAVSTGYGNGTLGNYVDAVRAEGKGFDGSTALGYKYLQFLQGNNGDNILQINLAAAGADTDWSDAGTLWFWVDTSEMTTSLLMEVMLDWKRPALGAACYFWDGINAPTQGTLPAAWNGNAKDGRVRLASGYRGWVGIPTAAYSGINLSDVGELVLYFEPTQDAAALPKTVYYDNFWITGAGETPNAQGGGGTPTPVPDPDPEFSPDAGKAVWTMEALPADLSASVVTCWGRGNLGEYVDAIAADGKGYQSSTALGYRYLVYQSGNNGDNILQITLGASLGAETDWSGEDLLWFWVDASELQTALLLEVMLNWTRPAIGTTYYLWNRSGTPAENSMPAAWGGNTTDGRIKLTSGYRGWVGVPLSAYPGLDLTNVNTMILYFEPDQDGASLPKTVYFDDFWLTAAGHTPDLMVVRGVKTAVHAFRPAEQLPEELQPTETGTQLEALLPDPPEILTEAPAEAVDPAAPEEGTPEDPAAQEDAPEEVPLPTEASAASLPEEAP